MSAAHAFCLPWMLLAVETPAGAQQSADEARYADAPEIARLKGITVAEARRRLRLQDDVDVLVASIRDIHGYNATVIDSGATYYHVIVIASAAANARIAASPLLRGTPLGAVTQFQTTRTDRATLKRVQQELVARLDERTRHTKQPWSVTIDDRAGQVVVSAPDPAALARFIDVARYGRMVRFRKETLFPRPVPGRPNI